MDQKQIVREVMRTVGLPEEEAARQSLTAVLVNVARQTTEEEHAGLVRRLPPDSAGVLEGATYDPAPDGDGFLERLAEHLGNGHGESGAIRHLRGVWRVLVEAVGQEALEPTLQALPEDLRERIISVPEASHRDLAEYRPADHLSRARQMSESSGHLRSLAEVDDNPRGISRRSTNERSLSTVGPNPDSIAEQD
ncbi:MAG: DUF2267 domain-containing protein [Myxococcota bacterium]